MARRKPTAFDLWRTSIDLGTLALETQAVVTMRMMGMAGLWPDEAVSVAAKSLTRKARANRKRLVRRVTS